MLQFIRVHAHRIYNSGQGYCQCVCLVIICHSLHWHFCRGYKNRGYKNLNMVPYGNEFKFNYKPFTQDFRSLPKLNPRLQRHSKPSSILLQICAQPWSVLSQGCTKQVLKEMKTNVIIYVDSWTNIRAWPDSKGKIKTIFVNHNTDYD